MYKYLQDPAFKETYKDFKEMRLAMRRGNKKIPYTDRAEKIVLNILHGVDVKTAIIMMESSIVNGWMSVYPPKQVPDAMAQYKLLYKTPQQMGMCENG